MFNCVTKSPPNNTVDLLGTIVPVTSYFSKPNFHKKTQETLQNDHLYFICGQIKRRCPKEEENQGRSRLCFEKKKLDKKTGWDSTFQKQAKKNIRIRLWPKKIAQDKQSEDERLAIINERKNTFAGVRTTKYPNTARSNFKTEFPLGPIVQIRGDKLDPETYEHVEHSPIFFGSTY